VPSSPWTANLAWLNRNDPSLCSRILAVPEPGRLTRSTHGLLWQRGLNPTRITEGEEEISAVLAAIHGFSGPVVLMGSGGGALLQALLEHTERTIVAWDRDPSFLKPSLQAVDWTPWLVQGRLRLAAGADLVHLEGQRVLHPQLGAAYADEHAARGGRPRALLVDGTLFVDDVGQALRDEGWDVFRWDVRDLPVDELERTAERLAPELVVGINHTNGLAEACERIGVPLVEWEIDPSTDALQPTRADRATVWTWRKRSVPTYRQAGFQAHYLPLATNPARRAPVELTPDERARYGVPVAYVGSSMVSRGRELLATFVQTFGRVFGDVASGQQIASQLLEIQASQAHARGFVLPQLLDQLAPDLADRFAAVGCRHRPQALLGALAAARYRLDVLASIADLDLHVWGDPGWEALAPAGATLRGWAGHFHELTRIYSGAQVHVDVGRLYQLDIVPMRIFDVIAAGGFVLAQHSEALTEVLSPGVEVVTWRTPQELRQKVAYYLANPEERAGIVHAGRRRILAEHTIRQRVRRMLAATDLGVRAA